MPEVIEVCKNNFPYTLNVDSNAYAYNLNMKYFASRNTIISKFNSSNNTWDVVHNSSDTKFTFPYNNGNVADRYAVYTTLNGDCWMTDTFNLNLLDTSFISSSLDSISPSTFQTVICHNGIGNLNIIADPFHREFLWQDGYANCLARHNNLTVEDTGFYYLKVTRDNGCYGRKIFRVNHKNTDIAKFTPADVLSCFDVPNTVLLSSNMSANTSNQFKWSSGSTNPTITVTKPGTYKLKVMDEDGCPSFATVNVIDTCLYPVHSDILNNSIVTKIDKIDFSDATKNKVSLKDPRTIINGIAYSNDDVVNKNFIVRLQYHRNEQTDDKNDIWSLYIPYKITIDGQAPTYRTLHLKKTDGGEDVYESIFEHEEGDEAQLEIIHQNIVAFDKNGNIISFNADIPNDINLELELRTKYVPSFNTATTIAANNIIHQLDNTDGKININWKPLKSAIEYELQILFIDKLDKNQTPNETTFKEKAWSIVTPDHAYTLDATYPSGTLFYRIRPIGRHIEFVNQNYNHVKNGTWSSLKEIDLMTNTFEQDKNWSKVLTLAGRRQEERSNLLHGWYF
jgi:hypothetical protein